MSPNRAADPVLVLGDSLGLPRPDAKDGRHLGADDTYPMMLLNDLPGHSVESHCQRFFTTRSVLDLLRSEPGLGAGSDVIIHVGLNDCATRMFLEHQRLALDNLPNETKERIVLFAQQQRRQILAHLPLLHYVDPVSFRDNLESCLKILKDRRATKVALATVILPPEKFWPGTPGMNQNFGRYNQAVMDAAASGGAQLFDIDRMVWARQNQDVLNPDGMHLSTAGHALFSEQLAGLLS